MKLEYFNRFHIDLETPFRFPHKTEIHWEISPNEVETSFCSAPEIETLQEFWKDKGISFITFMKQASFATFHRTYQLSSRKANILVKLCLQISDAQHV